MDALWKSLLQAFRREALRRRAQWLDFELWVGQSAALGGNQNWRWTGLSNVVLMPGAELGLVCMVEIMGQSQ